MCRDGFAYIDLIFYFLVDVLINTVCYINDITIYYNKGGIKTL